MSESMEHYIQVLNDEGKVFVPEELVEEMKVALKERFIFFFIVPTINSNYLFELEDYVKPKQEPSITVDSTILYIEQKLGRELKEGERELVKIGFLHGILAHQDIFLIRGVDETLDLPDNNQEN